jgi:hypothetical protein
MTRARVAGLIALLVVLLAPAQASASLGFMDWLEGLSGPGPFRFGPVFDTRLACQIEEPQGADQKPGTSWVPLKPLSRDPTIIPCLLNSEAVRSYFELRGGRASTDRQPLFSDTPPTELVGIVAAHTVQGYLMRQVDRAVALGVGAGAFWLSGTEVEGHPTWFVFTPISVAVTPLKAVLKGHPRLSQFVVVRFEETALVGNKTATQINRASTSRYHARTELVRSASITFDILPWLAR